MAAATTAAAASHAAGIGRPGGTDARHRSWPDGSSSSPDMTGSWCREPVRPGERRRPRMVAHGRERRDAGPVVLLVLGGSDCEALRDGVLGQPANTLSSLAYVAAAAYVLRRGGPPGPALALALVGIGSVLYHGPMPPGAGAWCTTLRCSAVPVAALAVAWWRRSFPAPPALAVVALALGAVANVLAAPAPRCAGRTACCRAMRCGTCSPPWAWRRGWRAGRIRQAAASERTPPSRRTRAPDRPVAPRHRSAGVAGAVAEGVLDAGQRPGERRGGVGRSPLLGPPGPQACGLGGARGVGGDQLVQPGEVPRGPASARVCASWR